ncbi:MAG: type II toxin-antitoxin system RelE/ParE family toxin [Lachnospiraceae bacterium]|nr:type II toxin-antitoxin system RelE/ParE family toxin [Lachnospiraceae bacterium]
MAEIKFSLEAITDLQQTKAYIIEELCNEQAAVNTVAKITKRIRMLADFPESGATLSTVIGIETDYRFLVCGNYTVFYRVENSTVYIVRILYGRRNYVQILFGEPQDN